MDGPGTQYWNLSVAYKLPENPDLLMAARSLEADALNGRTMVLQTCTNADTRVACQNDAEIAFRERISSIPGVSFVMGYTRPSGEEYALLNMTAEEAVSPTFNGQFPYSHGPVFNQLRPNAWVPLGICLAQKLWTDVGYVYSLVDPADHDSMLDYAELAWVLGQLIMADQGGVPAEQTLLGLCSQEGEYHLRAVDWFLNLGVSPNHYERTFDSPLATAARDYNSALAQHLLDHGATVDRVDELGRTPLVDLMAAPVGDVMTETAIGNLTDFAKTLLDHGANPNAGVGTGYPPLHTLMRITNGGGPDMTSPAIIALAELLIARGADVNGTDCNGWTPLMQLMSCEKYSKTGEDPQLALTNTLLAHKADISISAHKLDDPTDKAGFVTALDLAETSGLTDCLKLLQSNVATTPPAAA